MFTTFSMKFFCLSLVYIFSFAQLQAQIAPTKTGSLIIQSEAQHVLDFHNKIRKEVGSPPLEWSSELSAFAQEWANHLSANCKMEHRPENGKWMRKYGENIFWGMGREYSGVDASKSWFEEINNYKYEEINSSNWASTGHYTQMVWKKTTKIGMGIAKCPNGGIIIVANYDPPGNYMGEKPY